MKTLMTRFAAALMVVAAIISCTVSEQPDKLADGDFESVVMKASAFEWAEGVATKTHISGDASFTWADGDLVGIYPDVGTQVRFPIVGMEGERSDRANFTGGGWAVKNASRYMAYYPFISDMELDKTAVPVDYTSQCQDGLNSAAHLNAYDFMAAASVAPSNGEIAFDFNHMSSFLRLDLTVPKVGEYNTLTLTCQGGRFATKGTVDISAAAPAITPTHWSPEFVVNLQNFTTTTVNQQVSIYLLIPPVDLSGCTVRVNLRGRHSDCETSFTRGENKPFRPGSAYAPQMDQMTGGDIVKLESGPDFNVDIKSLVNGESYIYEKTDYRIQSIAFEVNNNEVPALPHVDVSAPDSPAPIYAYWNTNTKALIIRTPANRVYTGDNANGLFNGLDGLTSINLDNFSLTYATSIAEMFKGCAHITTLDLSCLNTSNIAFFNNLFRDCKRLTTLDISSFEVESARYLQGMFYGCEALTSLDLRGFRTSSNLLSLHEMFYDCLGLTSILFSNSFNTESVSDYYAMFSGCSSLTSLDISMFDTSNGEEFRGMFSGCTNLATLSGHISVTDKVTDLEYMFAGCTSLASLDVSDWDVSATNRMMATFANCSSLTSLDVSNWSVGNVNCFDVMFYECLNLATLDVSGWNTSSGVTFNRTFQNCSSLSTLDVSNFIVNNAINLGGMFSGCSSLASIDVTGFVTSNVTDFSGMFSGCSSLTTLDVSCFDTSKANYIRSMFSGCSGLTSLDLSHFDVSKVIDMSGLFQGCSSLVSINYGTFDTHYCESFESMYAGTGFTSLDLTFFNTSSAKSFADMFKGCHNLTNLDISSFDTTHVTSEMMAMLQDCWSLTEIRLNSSFQLYGPWYFATNMARDVDSCTIYCSQDFKDAWNSTAGVYYNGGILIWKDCDTGDDLI